MNKKRNPNEWTKSVHRLADNHGWKAAPGHKICVLDRGDLQFEYPQHWHVTPEEGALKVTDKPPPNDDCALRVSLLRFGPVKTGAPSLLLLLQNAFVECGHILEEEQVQRVEREDIAILWGEYREIDAKEQREAVWRIAMCHSSTPLRNLYGFFTFGFWPEHFAKADAFWRHTLASLIMDRPVADPIRGPQFH